jgi:hypothetical protein
VLAKSSGKDHREKAKESGGRVEVDYVDLTVPVTNPETGETHELQ